MHIHAPFTFASAIALGVWRFVGLRLHTCCGPVRGFLVFLVSGSYPTWASSSVFRSAWPVLPRPLSCTGSNPSLKPTRMLRAAYLVR